MRSQLVKAIFACALVGLLSVIANGQTGPQVGDNSGSKKSAFTSVSKESSNAALNLAGTVTVVIIKSAAKTAWATTKFAAKDVAKPIIVGVAKPLLLKVAPQITMFALKLTSNSLKKGIPVATKLGMTYLRTKLPI